LKLIHFGSPKEVEHVLTKEEVQQLGSAALNAIREAAESKVVIEANPDGGEPDMVNHPPHYTSDPSGVECITVTRHRSFNIGNAIKYLWRAGLKGGGSVEKQVEDLEKAIFYIKDEIKLVRGEID